MSLANQFAAYSAWRSRLATNIGIHLIKNQNGNFILGRQHGFQGQHHARHFAA